MTILGEALLLMAGLLAVAARAAVVVLTRHPLHDTEVVTLLPETPTITTHLRAAPHATALRPPLHPDLTDIPLVPLTTGIKRHGGIRLCLPQKSFLQVCNLSLSAKHDGHCALLSMAYLLQYASRKTLACIVLSSSFYVPCILN